MMRRLLLVMIGISVLVTALWWWQRGASSATAVSASLTTLLATENVAGFAQATEPDTIAFPRDLGPHEAFQTEWWYYTGNLQTTDGREFGYQFTIFRRALSPQAAVGRPQSEWRTNQIYFAHFTVSDIENETFYQQERFSRAGAGLAGAQAEPYRVWLEDWSASERTPGVVTLVANSDEVSLDLTLTQSLPPILHGAGGLSQKGAEAGNASYYYSLVQQPTTGTLQLGEETVAVSGISWKDHEFSTSPLGGGTTGWDWFSIQLENGTAVMFGQIRQGDGSLSPFSSGTFIRADGTTRPLSQADIELTVTNTWQSQASGAEYPAGWEIRLPAEDLVLTAVPLMPNQELTVSTIYWEGAVAYEGTMAGQPLTGRGYVELTGYAGTSRVP